MDTRPTPADPNSTALVQSYLDRIRGGEQDCVQSLLTATMDRLRTLARKIGGNVPGVKRFEQTDDLLQNSMVRLWKAFDKHHPPTPLDYYRLASAIMRRELIDMSRHYFGAQGMGANLARSLAPADSQALSPVELRSDETSEPMKLGRWTEFHEYIDQLDDEQRMLFDLLWYQGLTLGQAAEVAGSSERTMRRRWKEARLALYRALLEP